MARTLRSIGRVGPAERSDQVQRQIDACPSLLRVGNADTKGPSTDKDACVERGPHLGHNPVATQTAVKAVLKTVFKLG
jgi:hypothetical protein